MYPSGGGVIVGYGVGLGEMREEENAVEVVEQGSWGF